MVHLLALSNLGFMGFAKIHSRKGIDIRRAGIPADGMEYTTHMNRRLTKISKYLSFILRHHPEKIGLKLDADRWANIDELVSSANSHGKSLTLEQILAVVDQNEAKIFTLSDDGLRIRCSN